MLLNFSFALNYNDNSATMSDDAPLAFLYFLNFFARLTPGARFLGTAVSTVVCGISEINGGSVSDSAKQLAKAGLEPTL